MTTEADAELRNKIANIIASYAAGRGMSPVALGSYAEPQVSEIMQLFQAAQHQLVTELLEQLPKIPEKSEWRKYNDGPLGRMRAIDEVTSLLEQKRQELGGV